MTTTRPAARARAPGAARGLAGALPAAAPALRRRAIAPEGRPTLRRGVAQAARASSASRLTPLEEDGAGPRPGEAREAAADGAADDGAGVLEISSVVHAEASYVLLDRAEPGRAERERELELEDASDSEAEEAEAAEHAEAAEGLGGAAAAAETNSSLSLRDVLLFSVPALGATLTDPMMSFVDTAVVGQVSAVDLASLGPNSIIFGTASFLFSCFITTTTSFVSKAQAKGLHDKTARIVSDAAVLAVGVGMALTALLLLGRGAIFGAYNVQGGLLAPAAAYFDLRALSMPGVLLSMTLSASCMGRKDSRTPMLVALAAGLLNLAGDVLFVMGPWRMGAAGAALATTLSTYAGTLLFCWRVQRTVGFRFRVPAWRDIAPFVSTSSVLVLRAASIMAMFSILVAESAKAGVVVCAAYQVAGTVLNICHNIGEPISTCGQAFLTSVASLPRRTAAHVAYLQGSARSLRTAGRVFGAVGALGCLAVCASPALFTNDPAVARAVGGIAAALALTAYLAVQICIMDGLIIAAGDLGFTSGMAVLNAAATYPLMLATTGFLGAGLPGLWATLLLLEGIRFVQNAGRLAWLDRARNPAEGGEAADAPAGLPQLA